MKTSTFAKYVLMIIGISMILIFFSCGPAYNLKMAKKHLAKAEMKGAKVDRDTIYKNIILERTIKDTIVKFVEVNKLFTDTLTIETTKWKTWTRIDTVNKKIYQQVECKPDTVRVPVMVKTNIKAGFTNFELIGGILFALVVGFLVSRIISIMHG